MASTIIRLKTESKIVVESHLAKSSILKYDYNHKTNKLIHNFLNKLGKIKLIS